MRFVITLIIVGFFNLNGVFAQPDTVKVKVSKDKVKISGKLYYVHTVRDGETLYAIAKAYEVAQAAIVENNPEIYKGIAVGNTIKIPVVQELKNPNADKELYHIVKKGETLYAISREYSVPVDELSKINLLNNSQVQENQVLYIGNNASRTQKLKKALIESTPVEKAVSEKDSTISAGTYVVQPKETLFSISRRSGLSIKELEDANPFLTQYGLQIGQTLVIPQKEQKTTNVVVTTSKKKVDCPPYTYDSSTPFNVVLMLPLSINEGGFSSESEVRKADEIMQYYEGTLVAIDSLKNQGVSINLTVIDTGDDKDPDVISKALKGSAVKKADLIIGPVYSNAVSMVALFAESHKIPMVSPLASNAAILKDNPFLIQAANDASVLPQHAVAYSKKTEGVETILVVPSSDLDNKMIKTYKAALGNKVTELHYTQGRNTASQRDMLRKKLNPNRKNRFIVLSNNEVFVLDFLQNLSIASKEFDVEVLGTSRWLKFTSIDMQYIHGANVEMFVNNFVDYNEPNAKNFVRKFRNYYKTDPSNYAFRGFDVAYFFVDALKNYGPNFVSCLTNLDAENLHTPFSFVKVNEHGGYMNTGAVLIKHVPGYVVKKEKTLE